MPAASLELEQFAFGASPFERHDPADCADVKVQAIWEATFTLRNSIEHDWLLDLIGHVSPDPMPDSIPASAIDEQYFISWMPDPRSGGSLGDYHVAKALGYLELARAADE